MKTLLTLLFIVYSHAAQAQNLKVVVNATNPVDQISKDQLQDYFFKRNRSWPHGQSVRFFDRQDSSRLRKTFMQKFLDRSSRQIDQFWISQKFTTGDSAPTQVSSDSMIVNLIARFPGGIGYIEEGVKLPDSVKVIPVTGD